MTFTGTIFLWFSFLGDTSPNKTELLLQSVIKSYESNVIINSKVFLCSIGPLRHSQQFSTYITQPGAFPFLHTDHSQIFLKQ